MGIGRPAEGFSIFVIFAPTQENPRTRTSSRTITIILYDTFTYDQSLRWGEHIQKEKSSHGGHGVHGEGIVFRPKYFECGFEQVERAGKGMLVTLISGQVATSDCLEVVASMRAKYRLEAYATITRDETLELARRG